MKVQFVWFDLGLTLLENNHVEIYQKILRDMGYEESQKDIAAAYHLANKYFMKRKTGILGKGKQQNILKNCLSCWVILLMKKNGKKV